MINIWRTAFSKRKTLSHTSSFSHQNAFTLIELLVVIAIIGILAGVVIASLNSARAKARDARRLADMKSVQNALQLYYADNGTYPVNTTSETLGGWDSPADGVFIQPLITAGYLPANIADPMHSSMPANYRYYRYASGAYGCTTGSYVVLAIVQLESTNTPTRTGDSCYTQNPGEWSWVVIE